MRAVSSHREISFDSIQAKAFDKKTSVLHYLVRLVKRNDEELLSVLDDLSHVKEAELVILETLSSEIKVLKDEIKPIHETITVQAERLEDAGELVQMSLQELKEQKTTIRNIDGIAQYNKMDHHTGRTPMERFILRAEAQIDAALAFTESVKRKFSELLDYFGEDENMASNNFFGTMNRFLGEFGKAIEHVNREEKRKVCLLWMWCVFCFRALLCMCSPFSPFHSKRKKQSALEQLVLKQRAVTKLSKRPRRRTPKNRRPLEQHPLRRQLRAWHDRKQMTLLRVE